MPYQQYNNSSFVQPFSAEEYQRRLDKNYTILIDTVGKLKDRTSTPLLCDVASRIKQQIGFEIMMLCMDFGQAKQRIRFDVAQKDQSKDFHDTPMVCTAWMFSQNGTLTKLMQIEVAPVFKNGGDVDPALVPLYLAQQLSTEIYNLLTKDPGMQRIKYMRDLLPGKKIKLQNVDMKVISRGYVKRLRAGRELEWLPEEDKTFFGFVKTLVD